MTDIGSVLGLSNAWYDLGIVNASFLERARAVWDSGEDPNIEHYRYWAFREFVAVNRPLRPDMASALYKLGETDADLVMGGAIMLAIVCLAECPKEVLSRAMTSGRQHLIQAAQRRKTATSSDQQ